ncbi:MAG: SLC13 family permease [Bryobacteraceae bacterium]
MSPALASLLALVAAMLLSCFAPINAGFVALALAFLIGQYMAGLKAAAIASFFPSSLFLMLVSVTLLFALSMVNGTLEQVARRAVRLARGNRGVVPIVFFALAVVLGASGAGGIAAVALLAPMAMGIAAELKIGGFLMVIMLANGGNAGTFSPIAPTGLVAHEWMSRAGLSGFEWANFFNTLAAQSLIAFAGYFLLGGWRLFRGGRPRSAVGEEITPFTPAQKRTLAVIAAVLLAVFILRADVSLAAFSGAVLILALGLADEERALKAMPWSVILMVSGFTVLIGVLEKTGGMDLFTGLLARLSGPDYIVGAMAFVAGVVSVYSSSSGVVLPAFLATIPGLVARLEGGSALHIAYGINVGAHLVDVSPLSTMGALCLACASQEEDRRALFRRMMAWGWSMTIVGAVVCQLLWG